MTTDCKRRVRRVNKMPKPSPAEPCPCCGSDDIYVGPLNAETSGVACQQCGLNIGSSVVYQWQHRVGYALKTFAEQDDVARRLAENAAVGLWNKRA